MMVIKPTNQQNPQKTRLGREEASHTAQHTPSATHYIGATGRGRFTFKFRDAVTQVRARFGDPRALFHLAIRGDEIAWARLNFAAAADHPSSKAAQRALTLYDRVASHRDQTSLNTDDIIQKILTSGAFDQLLRTPEILALDPDTVACRLLPKGRADSGYNDMIQAVHKLNEASRFADHVQVALILGESPAAIVAEMYQIQWRDNSAKAGKFIADHPQNLRIELDPTKGGIHIVVKMVDTDYVRFLAGETITWKDLSAEKRKAIWNAQTSKGANLNAFDGSVSLVKVPNLKTEDEVRPLFRPLVRMMKWIDDQIVSSTVDHEGQHFRYGNSMGGQDDVAVRDIWTQAMRQNISTDPKLPIKESVAAQYTIARNETLAHLTHRTRDNKVGTSLTVINGSYARTFINLLGVKTYNRYFEQARQRFSAHTSATLKPQSSALQELDDAKEKYALVLIEALLVAQIVAEENSAKAEHFLVVTDFDVWANQAEKLIRSGLILKKSGRGFHDYLLLAPDARAVQMRKIECKLRLGQSLSGLDIALFFTVFRQYQQNKKVLLPAEREMVEAFHDSFIAFLGPSFPTR